ncbi:hypothetical protein [Jiangella mangrovi]|uniref:Outer membrane murein-binding lipoprotein Lpp n=1 Tax=Jiangella mangrovi TaxID=1524084 RepID=A0A7W9GXC8_9ACTN|nr:hypothetical protein [Jiangella mangrovi]MBB5791822.1 outer membrane murein-binding lipoprotein Lpp [Jiangella mangrovi]
MTTPTPPASPSDEPESLLPDEPEGEPSRVRGRVIAGVVAAVTFVAGIAIGALVWSGDGDEPEQPVAASSDTAALEEQVTTLQGQVDELTSERDGLRESVTQLEAAAEAAAAATATPAAQETPAAPPASQPPTTQPPAPPATPAEEDETPPAAGTYTAGQFEFADVQVSDDGIGGFALRARVTNTGEAVAGALWTATLFLDGVVVATLNGSAQSFAAGATLTAEFWSADPFGEYDAVEFQVDGQF